MSSNVGYNDDDDCALCPDAYYCDGSLSGHHKQSCGDHMQTNLGASSADDCTCVPGYQKIDGACSICPPNTYSHPLESSCVSCGANRVSPEGTVDFSGCVAAAGYYLPGNVLEQCPADSNSFDGATAITDCACNAGFSGPNGGPCVACEAGTYLECSSVTECASVTTCSSCPSLMTTAVQNLDITSEAQCYAEYLASSGSKNWDGCRGDASIGCNEGSAWNGPTQPYKSYGCHKTLWQGKYEWNFNHHVGGTDTSKQVYCTLDCPFVEQTGSTTPDDCTCEAGSHDPVCAGAEDCVPTSCENCPVNTYKPFIGTDACTGCLGGRLSPAGSTDQSECVCPPGETLESDTCTPCARGKYKTGAGDGPCTDCSATSFTVTTGQTAQTACQCNAGYYQSVAPDTCLECQTGKYKTSLGDQICTPASVGQVTTLAGAVHPGTGSDGVTCAAGYRLFSGVCTLCAAGTFKTSPGTQACDTCIDNSFSTASRTACECNAGYTAKDGACTACAEGKYKFAGSAPCEDCPEHAYSSQASVSPQHCFCNVGYEAAVPLVDGVQDWLQHSCTACEVDEYKSTTGNTDCLSCTANSFSLPAAAECACNAGYSQSSSDPLTCENCLPGTYKTSTGSAACDTCPDDAYHTLYASTSASDCKCNAGYTGSDGGTCTACPENTFKGSVGDAACSSCPDSSSSSGQTDSTSLDEACICPPGSTGLVSGPCELCASNTYKDTPGSAACSTCPDFSTSLEGSSALSNCHCNSEYARTVSGGVTTCELECGPGFSAGEHDLVCYECAVGKYKDATGSASCTDCPDFSVNTAPQSSTVNDCICQQGYTRHTDWPSDATCTPCPSGTFNNEPGESTCYPCYTLDGFGQCVQDYTKGSTECPGICQVPAGMQAVAYNDIYTNVESCPEGTWNDGSHLTCQHCPSGSTHHLTHQTSVTACECEAGYDVYLLSCAPCDFGHFKPEFGNSTTCQECPEDTTTLQTGSVDSDSCVCDVGFGTSSGNAADCAPCNGEFAFKFVAGNQDCVTCPDNSVLLPESSHSVTACQCNKGYTGPGGASDGQCSACNAGYFKSVTGPSACQPCNQFETSPLASISDTACVCDTPLYVPDPLDPETCIFACNAGETLDTSGVSTCVDCDAGTFKTTGGTEPCTDCSAPHTRSPAGSTAADDCICPANTFAMDPDAFVVIQSVGAHADLTTITVSILPHTVSDALLSEIVIQGDDAVEVVVENHDTSLTIFKCHSNCGNSRITNLAQFTGSLHVRSLSNSPLTQSVLIHHHTRKVLSFHSNPTWLNAAAHLAAEQFATVNNLRTGDFIFNADVTLSSATHCQSCPPQWACV